MPRRVIVMRVAKLMGEGAQGLRVVHPVADSDRAAVREPRGLGAPVMPQDFVAAPLCGLYEHVNQ